MKLRTYLWFIAAAITAVFLLQAVLHRDTGNDQAVVVVGDSYKEREQAWRRVVNERETLMGRMRAELAGRQRVRPDTIVVYDTIVVQDTVYLALSMDNNGQLELVTGVAVDSAVGFTPTREVYGLQDCDDGFTLVPGSMPVCNEARAGHLWLGLYVGGTVDSLVVAMPGMWLGPSASWQPSYRNPWRVQMTYDVLNKRMYVGVARGMWVF